MPRRRPRSLTAEPAVIAQANPTKEQRGRARYVEDKTVDPFGETLVQGKVKSHPVCRKQPIYKLLRVGNGFCTDTIKVLDWYADRHAVASKGYTADSLTMMERMGGGGSVMPIIESRAIARGDTDAAKSYIKSQLCLIVFEAVMEQERTFTELGGGNNDHEAVMIKAFKLAANHLLLGVGARALGEPR